jgi:hypothetical protein
MKLKPVLGESRPDGQRAIDMNSLARNLGMTREALDMKLQSLGFQQIWGEAKRLSFERVFGTKDVLNPQIEDADVLEAASSLLAPPLPFIREKQV